MRSKVLLILIAVVMSGVSTANSTLGQQSANNNLQSKGETAKSCVLVYGAVRSPSRFRLERPLRLAEAIEMAGGANEHAAGTVQISHTTGLNCDQQEGRLVSTCIDYGAGATNPAPAMDFYLLFQLRENERNPYLQPGDMVHVVEAPSVYVVGNILFPQSIHLEAKMTLLKVIAMAGGVLSDSDTKRIRIIRQQQESKYLEIIVDLNAIKKGRGEDLVLEPYDVIDVPPKKGRHGNFLFGPVVLDAAQFPVRAIL